MSRHSVSFPEDFDGSDEDFRNDPDYLKFEADREREFLADLEAGMVEEEMRCHDAERLEQSVTIFNESYADTFFGGKR